MIGTNSSTLSVVWVALLGIAVSLLWTAISSSSSSYLAFHPELYHGEGKTHHFFEGWYHKLVRTRISCGNVDTNVNNCNGTTTPISANIDSLSMAVVPGVFYDSSKGNGNGNDNDNDANVGKNESHAFIFVTINGEKQHYYRFDLDTELKYRKIGSSGGKGKEDYDDNNDDDYYVEIGNNRFSKHGISLDLVPRFHDDASIALKGSVQYKQLSPWPIPSFRNLGAMGPIGYFLSPFLECYHDVLSFDHKIEGRLTISSLSNHNSSSSSSSEVQDKDGSIDKAEEFFDTNCDDNNNDDDNKNTCVSSRGYVEKDRGRSFPSLWIWMQTNSFRNQPQNSGTSLFFSVARIPILAPVRVLTTTSTISVFLRKVLPKSWAEPEFPGFTAAVWLNVLDDDDDATSSLDEKEKKSHDHGGTKKLIPFATWTGAYFEDLIVEEERVVVVLNSGGIGGGLSSSLWSLPSLTKSTTRSDYGGADGDRSNTNGSDSTIIRVGRLVRAWIGSWFINYDSRKLRYRLELIADRRVPHVMLYAPKTTSIETANLSSGISTTSRTTRGTSSSKMEPFVNEALNAKVRVRLYEYDYSAENGEFEQERLLLDDIGEHAGLEVHQNVQYLVDNLCGKPTANWFTCL